MYITFLAGSPCAKTVSFLANLATFRPRPVESRNFFTSKTRVPEFPLFGRRRTGTDTLRPRKGSICQYSQPGIPETVQNCTVSQNDSFYIVAVKVSAHGGKAKCMRLTGGFALTVGAWRRLAHTDMGVLND